MSETHETRIREIEGRYRDLANQMETASSDHQRQLREKESELRVLSE